MSSKNYLSYTELASQIKELKSGDIVNVSSDILKLICVCRENSEKFDPDLFIDSILKKVGSQGTVLFPTYNWDFCKGIAFDYINTSSQTGGLGNTALKRADFKRTPHPIYSFAVWGKHQDEICSMPHTSCFGKDSPFDFLYQSSAKNLFVGIDYKEAFAFVHYPEEIVGVDYRYFKDFKGRYIDKDSKETEYSTQMYVRDLEKNVITRIHPNFDDVLMKHQFYSRYSLNDVYFGIVDIKGFGDLAMNDLRNEAKLIFPDPL